MRIFTENSSFFLFCIIGLFCVFLLGLPIKGFSYSWPMDSDNDTTNGVDLNTQHEITSTFAECRESRDHFHTGVDIGGSDGTMIFAIESGIAHISGSGINVGHFRYYHVRNFQVSNNDTVEAGQLMAYTDGQNHLHFMESATVLTAPGLPAGAKWLNALREGALNPFNDNADPVIDEVSFWRQGTSEQITEGPLFGNFDLTVEAHDPRTSSSGGGAGGHCGIYKLRIEFWREGECIGDVIDYHIYDCLPSCSINLVFAPGSSTIRHIYWATNDPFSAPHNKYWNTKQRKESDYTVNARIPQELMYPEGNLQIQVIAEDVRGNSDVVRIGQQE